MADFLSANERSKRMSLIRKKDTKPELLVRRIVHSLGYRFRLHRSDLPGTPDIVLPRHRKVIDIRGCFWHSHSCRNAKPAVASRIAYWHPKLIRTVARDRRAIRALRHRGWRVLIVWECQTGETEKLTRRIEAFLSA